MSALGVLSNYLLFGSGPGVKSEMLCFGVMRLNISLLATTKRTERFV